jgi:small subunit ribosomal protein S16
MVKIRLARGGRKKLPIYKIIAADSRSRRDGRFIESLGQYRPSNEAGQKITFNEERIMYWLRTGAQPTTTVRALLSKEGILLKWHLEKKKIEPARAAEIFTTWKTQKDAKNESAMNAKERAREDAKRKLAAEKKAIEDAKAAEVAAQAAAEAAEAKAAEEAAAAASAPEAANADVTAETSAETAA